MNHPAMALDYGTVRIGVAASDACGILAYPLETIQQHQGDPIERIKALCTQHHIKTLVLGLPIRYDGTEGTAAERVRAFGEQISAALPEMPLLYEDEFLSTATAQDKLRAAGKKAKNQRSIIDQAAAVEILQSAMGLN